MHVGRSVQRSNRPPRSFRLNRPSSVLQAADYHWRTMNIRRLDGIRSGWLHVASCSIIIILLEAARLVQVLQDFFLTFIVVVTDRGFSLRLKYCLVTGHTCVNFFPPGIVTVAPWLYECDVFITELHARRQQDVHDLAQLLALSLDKS